MLLVEFLESQFLGKKLQRKGKFRVLMSSWKLIPKLSDLHTLSQTGLLNDHTLHSGTYP